MEAKAHSASRGERNRAVAQSRKTPTTAADILKLFKKASSQAVKIGTAQLKYEDMVRRAERKLAERERRAKVSIQSDQEKAEAIAQELFHQPGSMLTSEEIAHMYQESECAFAREEPDCTFALFYNFRTIDGTCNNFEFPLFGAANTNFRRLIPGQYEDGISSPRGDLQNRFTVVFPISGFSPPNPSARFISDTVILDKQADETPFTHILMQWGQFLDHDLDLSPEIEEECEECIFTEVCDPIRVSPHDEEFGNGTLNNGNCLPFRRSLPSCPTDTPGSFSPREQLNAITSFIDGSMVYGSTEEVGDALREFKGGLLRVGPNFPANQPSLPVIDEETAEFIACPDRDDCFLCGDARCNEQISLTMMHTIWVREHNRCAKELAGINPFWDDERLYQECRRIVGALIQKITYRDYLPKVFGVENYDFFVGPYPGYLPDVDPSVPNAFATAAYRYGHSLIRPQFDRLAADFSTLNIGPLNLVNAFFNPTQFKASLGTDPILRGLVNVNSLRMDEFLNSVLTTQLFQTPASPGLDLAALNIHRGRDHGLPPYTIWRNFCARVFGTFGPFENFITNLNFLNVYGSLDTVDLWIAGLAEERLPDSLLGPTFACLFGLTFANVRNGDAFYYDRPGVFTPEQVKGIKQDTLSRVLCDNLDNLPMIQPDAFLSNFTARVPCNQIPRLDLNLFKEEPCYYRVRVEPRPFDTIISTLTRVDTLGFIVSQARFPPSSAPEFQCTEIQCPTSADKADVIIYGNPEVFDDTSVTSDPTLPPSAYVGGAYVATWDRPTFNAGLGGVFTSLSACQGSVSSALDFTFGSRAASLAQAQSEGGDKIPKELAEKLKDKVKDHGARAQAGKASEVKEKMAAKQESLTDDALIQELESVLKHIN